MRSLDTDPGSKEIEDLFANYAKTLPQDFNDRFPSLYNIYGVLSDAIHKADRNKTLFENAHADIVRHFKAKQLYEDINRL